MLHETIFNATSLATLEARLLLDKYGGQWVKKTAAENNSGSVVSGRFWRTTKVSSHRTVWPSGIIKSSFRYSYFYRSFVFNKLRHLVCLLSYFHNKDYTSITLYKDVARGPQETTWLVRGGPLVTIILGNRNIWTHDNGGYRTHYRYNKK